MIAEDTTWSGKILITKDVLVLRNVHLKIEPGTVIRFKKSKSTRIDPRFLFTTAELLVEGQLTAQGSPEEPIIFTSDAKDPQAGDWAGIILNKSGADTSIISYCKIEFAQYGIYAVGSSAKITQNQFNNNQYGIVCQLDSKADISQNHISGGDTGIACWNNAAPSITNNRVFDNKHSGITWGVSANPVIKDNIIEGNRFGIFGKEKGVLTPDNNKIEHNDYNFYVKP